MGEDLCGAELFYAIIPTYILPFPTFVYVFLLLYNYFHPVYGVY